MQYVVPADVEDWLRLWLGPKLASLGWSVWCGARLPSTLPAESVQIYRTGGVQGTIRSSKPLVTVECRAKKEARAFEIAATVDGLVLAAGRDGVFYQGTQLYSARGGPPVSLPDPVHPMPRYTALYELHLSGEVREVL